MTRTALVLVTSLLGCSVGIVEGPPLSPTSEGNLERDPTRDPERDPANPDNPDPANPTPPPATTPPSAPDRPTYMGEPLALPILLMHHDVSEVGGRFSKTVHVEIDDPAGIGSLWLRAHNLSYENKGSIRINDGAWVPLNNDRVTCAYPESEWDCVGGPYHTIRLTVPVDGLVAGVNRIDVSYDGTDGVSSGWRVIDLNLLDAEGRAILGSEAFAVDDPGTWSPPLSGADQYAEGERLFNSSTLITQPGGTPIRASCADCHATDGRDLLYFNYSNDSIIARARFHGLSELEGQQIASWVRSLPYYRSDRARPWHPPYQPGPGTDARPAREWAAGAGLDWVLDDDAASLDYAFPDGITPGSVRTDQTINLREIPIAMQLPDWNHWLPVTHPLDAWGDEFASSSVPTAWNNEVPTSQAEADGLVASGRIIQSMTALHNAVDDFRSDSSRPLSGHPMAVATRSLMMWGAVRAWEAFHKFELEDDAPALYPGDGEKYSWFGQIRVVFNIAPHISGSFGASSYANLTHDEFFNHAWYHLQIIMNPGNRDVVSIRPVDWKYHFGHAAGYSQNTRVGAGARYALSYIKAMEMMSNDQPVGARGWYLPHMHPIWLIRGYGSSGGKYPNMWLSLDRERRATLSTELMRAWIAQTRSYPTSSWPRGTRRGSLEPASFVPSFDAGADHDDAANGYYTAMSLFRDLGISDDVRLDAVAWGQEMWPAGDWEVLR